eukprot:g938.t1
MPFLNFRASKDETTKHVGRVLMICAVIAVVVIIQGMTISYLRSQTGNARVASDLALVKVMYGLSLPLLGYLGARLRSSTILGFFTGCNICGLIFFGYTVHFLIRGMRHIDEWIDQCKENEDKGLTQNIPCDTLHYRYMQLVLANFVFGAVLFVLNVLGCVWGFQLCRHRQYGGDDDMGFGSGAHNA